MALDCRLPLPPPPIDFGPSFCHSSAAVRSSVRSFDARKFWNNFRVPLVIRFFSLSLRFRSWELGTRFRFRIQVARFHLVFAVVVVVVLTSITFE